MTSNRPATDVRRAVSVYQSSVEVGGGGAWVGTGLELLDDVVQLSDVMLVRDARLLFLHELGLLREELLAVLLCLLYGQRVLVMRHGG